MPTRRQEKVARVVKEAVSDAIANHLSDPRIKGFVSVTRVDMSPDLRSADVYLSVFGAEGVAKRLTFEAIEHARVRIQSRVAAALESKFCPVLRLHNDEHFHKTLDILRLIDEVADKGQNGDAGSEP